MMKLALPIAILGLLLLAGCTSQEDAIRAKIAEANYCETTADCAVTTGVCPFDCYVLTHRSQSGAIAKILSDYPTTCAYSCIQQPPVACVQGKCVFEHKEL